MIIWGSKAKQKQIATGSFYCPQCRQQSSYAHIRVSRYFTLYFILLFATQTLGEGICCHSCKGGFALDVLTLTAGQIEAALRPWACPDCSNLNSSTETNCLACGTVKVSTPPPLPGSPQALPDNDERYKPKD